MRSHRLRCGAFLVLLLSAFAARAESPSPAENAKILRIGAVAYSPAVVTVFQGLTKYLKAHDFPADYVLYSNYDALVAALEKGEVDIAWNTPLAHAQYHVRNGCESQTLVMRDVDREVHSMLLVRADAGIESLADLAGKRLILGSEAAAEATVLPRHFLTQRGAPLERMTIISLDQEVDFAGNPCCSPEFVLKALCENRGEAGIVTADVWEHAQASQPNAAELKAIWMSPPFSHCVFTAAKDFDPALGKRFTELMTAMKPTDAATSEVMALEGTREWLPGSPEGFEELVKALRAKE